MSLTTIRGDLEVQGVASFGSTVGLPAGSVTTSTFSAIAADRLAYTKAVHYGQHLFQIPLATTVASQTVAVYMAYGSATISHLWIRPLTSPAGGDLKYTVDLRKSVDGSATLASVLSAAVEISSADTSQTQQAANVTTTGVDAKDVLYIVITTSGSTGTQGAGLVVALGISEQPT
jgi:hypothetical protein